MIFFFDIFFAISFVLIFFPLILLISILIFFLDGSPIIYISKRVGKNQTLFNIYKFRTMKNNTKKDKITIFGKILRRTSLDELPQLINILKGEMSFVGPRPLPLKIFNKITKKKRIIRCSVKPGITGYSQVRYKGKKRSLNEKVDLDIFYIKKINLWEYFNILFLTPLVIIKRFIFNQTGKTL